MEQLHIAICDDESMDLIYALDLIRQYDTEQQFVVNTFLRTADFLTTAKTNPFDIVLLDIEMPPPTGFDVAQQLTQDSAPPSIIFTTKSNAYAIKGYGIAIRYLQKPIMYETLSEALDVAISEANAHRLTIQIDNVIHAIRLRDVQYIEVFGHYAVIHTDKDSYRYRSSLKEIIGRLPRGFFAVCHKSYVVNMEHIKSATSTEIIMDTGAVVPIGRTKAQEFNQAFYRFLGR